MSDITFSDVLIEPQYSEVESRSSVDISSNMGSFSLNLPIISANMRDVTGEKMCIEMAKLGGLGILHRFMSIEDNVESFKNINNILEWKNRYAIGVSVGVKDEDKKRFDQLWALGARLFCIDIAHGHSLGMRNMLEYIVKNSDNLRYIIAGNIATPQAFLDLTYWGANCCKCGIGAGGVCLTRTKTGVGVPQLQALMDIDVVRKKNKLTTVKLISDGGIKHIGDIPKALKYSDAVMIGSLISGTTETPGKVFRDCEGKFYKTYGGSASGENKVKNGGENKFVEGMVTQIPFRGHVKYIIREIEDGLRSALSYSGVWSLKEFQEKAILKEISFGGKIESKIESKI